MHKETSARRALRRCSSNSEVSTKRAPLEPTGWPSAMPPPLTAGAVTYADGTEASLENEAEDVSAFLMWAAEPKMMTRKESGLKGVLLMGLLSVLLYLTNKRLWSKVKGKKLAH